MELLLNENKISIKKCFRFKDKLLGLMFKKNFNYGIVLEKCSSIHTFFMKESIDVIMTDKNYKVKYIYNNLKKNKIILPKKGIYYTFELPSNTNTYKIGEKLKFIPYFRPLWITNGISKELPL